MVQWVRSPDGADIEITVRPNHWQARPLPHKALAASGVLAGAVAGAFWQLGAWPVLPFAALAVGGLAAACAWHARSAGDYERLIFHDRRLRIERHHSHGRGHHRGHHSDTETREFNLAWASLVEPAFGHGLRIACHGRLEHVGDCLGAGELRLLRRLLRRLLGNARTAGSR